MSRSVDDIYCVVLIRNRGAFRQNGDAAFPLYGVGVQHGLLSFVFLYGELAGVLEHEPRINRAFIGKNPSVIAKAIGLNLSDDIRVLWAEVPNDHPLIFAEQLMPVLPITVAPDVDTAIEMAHRAEGNNHHSSGMGVKASGGIKDGAAAEQMIKAGASRLGTSASILIVTGKGPSSKY